MKRRNLLCATIIALGLALRAVGLQLGLPVVLVKYGGSVLWGTMVYLLVAISSGRSPRMPVAGAALLIAIAVELFRLYHTPFLDQFRLSLAGALLLGRIFSLWNMVAYAVGIVLGVAFDRAIVLRKTGREEALTPLAPP